MKFHVLSFHPLFALQALMKAYYPLSYSISRAVDDAMLCHRFSAFDRPSLLLRDVAWEQDEGEFQGIHPAGAHCHRHLSSRFCLFSNTVKIRWVPLLLV